MKRVCSLLLTLVICGGLLTVLSPTAAAEPVPVTFGLGATQGLVGDVLEIDVNISADSGILAFELNIEVPTDYLEPTTVTDSNSKETYFTVGDLSDSIAISTTKGIVTLPDQKKGITLNVAGTEGLWEAGTVCRLYFRLIRALPAKGIEIPITVTKCIHCKGKKIPYDITTENGKVTPAKPPSSTVSSKPSMISIWPTFSEPEWRTSSVTARPTSSAPARSASKAKTKTASAKSEYAKDTAGAQQEESRSVVSSSSSADSLHSALNGGSQAVQSAQGAEYTTTALTIVLAVAAMVIVVLGVIIVVLLIRRKQ